MRKFVLAGLLCATLGQGLAIAEPATLSYAYGTPPKRVTYAFDMTIGPTGQVYLKPTPNSAWPNMVANVGGLWTQFSLGPDGKLYEQPWSAGQAPNVPSPPYASPSPAAFKIDQNAALQWDATVNIHASVYPDRGDPLVKIAPSKGVDLTLLPVGNSLYFFDKSFFIANTSKAMVLDCDSFFSFEKQAWADYLTGTPNAGRLEDNRIHLRNALLFYSFKTDQGAQLQSFDHDAVSIYNVFKGKAAAAYLHAFQAFLSRALQLAAFSTNQTWGFPDSSLYLNHATPSYVQLFYQFLAQGQSNGYLTTDFGTAKTDFPAASASSMAQQAKRFLFGVERELKEDKLTPPFSSTTDEGTYLSSIQTAYQSLSSSGRVPGFTSGSVPGIPLDPSAPQIYSQASQYELNFPSPDSQFSTSNDYLFTPPSANLVSDRSVENYHDSGLGLYEQPVSQPATLSASPTTIVLQFATSQKIASILMWVSADATIPSVGYVDSKGSFQPVPIRQQDLVALIPAPISGTSQYHLTPIGTQPAPAYLLKYLNLAQPISSTGSLTIQFAGTSLLNFRVYAEPVLMDQQGTWVVDQNQVTYASQGKSLMNQPEYYSSSGANSSPYFLISGYQSGTAQLSSAEHLFSPIRYARGGLETPLTYDLKVYNNVLWSNKTRNYFFTELDGPQERTKKLLDSNFTYLNSTAPGPFAPAQDQENMPFPFTMGINLANRDGIVLNANSPFFVDKMAGIDSFGMLFSALGCANALGQGGSGYLDVKWSGLDNWPKTSTFLQQLTLSRKLQDILPDPAWFLKNSRVIVPSSTANVQPGDILVGYEGTELCVAIVVDVPSPMPGSGFTSSESLNAWMETIKVLTINRSLQRAVYTTWAKMSLTPQAYHIRRLVGSSFFQNKDPGSTVSGFFQLMPESPSYHFTRSDGWENWIPNTGELHDLGRIVIDSNTNLNGQTWSLDSVYDYGYDPNQAGAGNIYNNSSTRFYVVALDSPHKEDGKSILRADKSFDPANTHILPLWLLTQSRDDPRIYTCTALGGIGSDEVRFLVDSGYLTVSRISSTPSQPDIYRFFALVAFNPNPGDPYAGDDIQLVLNFAGNPSISTAPLGPDGKRDFSKTPRLAVYDKMLLWRANSYVEDLGNDWNDLHPWNDATNDWNTARNGKQIPILAFSSPRFQFDSSTNDDVRRHSVAYDYPRNKANTQSPVTMLATDTPTVFNQKMQALQSNLRQVFTDQGIQAQGGNRWPFTTAPGHRWGNYLPAATNALLPNVALPSLGLLYYDWPNSPNLDQDLIKAPGTTGQAFFDNGPDPDQIGTDCVGFVHNSVNYSALTYRWSRYAFRSYPDPAVADTATFAVVLANNTDDPDVRTSELKSAVPGDIFFYSDKGNAHAHIGIVQYNESGTMLGIRLIEAYFNGKIAYVDNSRTLKGLVDQGHTAWTLVRLQ